MTLNQRSGQSLLIAILILAVLLITIPAIVFVNSQMARSGVAIAKKQKSTPVAQEGVSYATHVLSSSSTWKAALAGTCPAEFSKDGTSTPNVYTTPSGGAFTVQCLSGNPSSAYALQSYEVQVKVHGGKLDPTTGTPGYGKATTILLGQKTLAAVLPTGVQASAALELMHVPVNSAALVVHWGPVVVFDSNPWALLRTMDAAQFPRKFSQGGIIGSAFPRSQSGTDSDKKEYWANSSLGFANLIDMAVYQSSAQALTFLTTPPTSKNSPGTPIPRPTTGACVGNPNCGYFNVAPGDTAVFDGGPVINAPNTVIYINGDAEFDDVMMDLKNGGALIVNGNLTLNAPGSHGVSLSLRVPHTAAKEYPYYPSNPATSWPCKGLEGQTCGSHTTGLGVGDSNGLGTGGGDGKVFFRGFLYVTGNLTVNNTGWLVAGAIRVDGALTVLGPRPRLTLLYDDEINHHIAVNPMELMVDYQKDTLPCIQ